MHRLQEVFASEAGETAWAQDMHAMFGAGAFDEAEAQLAEALSALDSELAWICLELPREAVVLSGWEELGEAIALHEGEAVTGVTIAIGNDGDRDFEKGRVHRPHVLLGIYTDEAFAFSQAQRCELFDQCHAATPAWAGREEDIEVHLDIEGLDGLNTRLVHHKHRHFFRDAVDGPKPGHAPGYAPRPYVEFVLGCWWRALRWHQAVATECAIRGLPRGIPVIAGMVDMRPEAMAVHDSGKGAGGGTRAPKLRLVRGGVASLTETFGDGFIQRKQAEPDKAPPTALELRRLVREERKPEGEVLERPAAPGLWARIFGRR